MNTRLQSLRQAKFVLALAVLALPGLVLAASRPTRGGKPGRTNPQSETVELFRGIDSGMLSVKLIPKDSTETNVLIENKTKKPLSVKLPEVFAGVPVLAQRDTTTRSSSSSDNNSNQSFGGGMGGMGMMGGGMGMFNVAPEKVGKLKVATVCLEHGKDDPRAAIPYEIKPLNSFTEKAGVAELMSMLGSGKVSQRAAQAAAWHLNNNMTWEELAAKQLRSANGATRPYFAPQEIKAAIAMATVAVKAAEQKKTSGNSQYQSASAQ